MPAMFYDDSRSVYVEPDWLKTYRTLDVEGGVLNQRIHPQIKFPNESNRPIGQNANPAKLTTAKQDIVVNYPGPYLAATATRKPNTPIKFIHSAARTDR